MPDGYLLFTQQWSFEYFNKEHIYIRKLDPEGNYQYQLDHWAGDDRRFDLGYIDAVASNVDGSFSAVINEGRGYDAEHWLYRFDQSGDTIGRSFILSYPFSDSITLAVRQLRSTTDGGHVWCGFHAISNTNTRALIGRSDNNGDTLWTRKFGAAGQAYTAVGVAEYFDGGYLLTGYRIGPPSLDKGFLIRTDAEGNELWRRFFGNRADVNGAVRVAADGSIFTWSEYRDPQWPSLWQQMMLSKWDQEGNLVWQRKVNYNRFVGTYDLELLDDGSMVATGTAFLQGVLIKFSAEGDSLWSRGYSYTNDLHKFFDVEPTSDGGFVCTGAADRYFPLDPQYQTSQMIWVVKTDSLGCVVPGCHTVGVEEYLLDLNEHLHVWPNPVASGTPLSLSFTPPPEFAAKGPLRVVVLDAAGRLVLEQALPKGGHPDGIVHTLDAPALASGTYHLHLPQQPLR
ncbi:MAG: hypothetical protein KF905_11985 [Flavobacteriales bacterium]|nr:hypothetical protein [Flavobacteriales bacterium]